jgi:E3 ubiquitin-protein ligase NRDP1
MVDAQEFGYDKTRFPKLAENNFDYDCVICSEVVRTPTECTGCGGLFCSACIKSWLLKKKECPNRCTTSGDSIKPVGKALMRMYNELDIKCIHFDKCNQTCKLIDLDKHEKVCQLPRCGNFDLCGNLLNERTKGNGVCSPECSLLAKLRAANGDYGLMHRELKEFMAPYVVENKAIKVIAKPDEDSIFGTPNLGGSGGKGAISFKWDAKHCGTNIALTDNGCTAWLKENSYIFKTVLGDQAFYEGVHYWEIQADPRTENELKIGISLRNDFDSNSAFCDFEYGYAYYGLGQLRHNSNANGVAYGKKFKKEGALGICLDMNKGTLSFGLDGQSFGVAYQAPALKKGPIWPAVALLHAAGCKLISGKPVPQYFLN